MEHPPLKTFIIYARDDAAFKSALRRHLTPLEQLALLEVWDDSHLLPGEEWEKSIEEKLDESDLVLMLVSEASLFSDFIQKKELKTALARKQQGVTQFVPILVRDCLWDLLPDFKNVQMLPLDPQRSLLAVEAWLSQSSAWAAALRELHRLIPGIQEKIAADKTAREAALAAEQDALRRKNEAEKTEKLRHNRDEAAWKKTLAEVAAADSPEDKIEVYATYLEDHDNHRDEAETAVHALEGELSMARKLKEKAERKRQAAEQEAQRKAEEEARQKSAAEKERQRIAAEQEAQRKTKEEARQKAAAEKAAQTQNMPDMILIEGGTFQMGSKDGGYDREKPAHTVAVKDFYLGKYPVTVAQFKTFIDASAYQTDADKDGGSYLWNGNDLVKTSGVNWRCDVEGKIRPEGENQHPVIHISWNDARAYCVWLTEKTGQSFRLPSEAEWEYAARGGRLSKGFQYAGSNDLKEVGWYHGNSGSKTHRVGEKKPNELGLYDMSGNVWEWCEDDWHGSYKDNPPTDGSAWVDNPRGSYRVNRGGSWYNTPAGARVASRVNVNPADRNDFVGFRLARTP